MTYSNDLKYSVIRVTVLLYTQISCEDELVFYIFEEHPELYVFSLNFSHGILRQYSEILARVCWLLKWDSEVNRRKRWVFFVSYHRFQGMMAYINLSLTTSLIHILTGPTSHMMRVQHNSSFCITTSPVLVFLSWRLIAIIDKLS